MTIYPPLKLLIDCRSYMVPQTMQSHIADQSDDKNVRGNL